MEMKHIAPVEYPEQYMMCVIRVVNTGICAVGYYEPELGWYCLDDVLANEDETVEWCGLDNAAELLFGKMSTAIA